VPDPHARCAWCRALIANVEAAVSFDGTVVHRACVAGWKKLMPPKGDWRQEGHNWRRGQTMPKGRKHKAGLNRPAHEGKYAR
jgi:hypothetical protein